MTRYAKLYAALVAMVAIALTVTADGSLTLHDGLLVGEAGLGALGVYAVPNRPPVDRRHPAGRDRGDFDVISAAIFVTAFIVGYLWARR